MHRALHQRCFSSSQFLRKNLIDYVNIKAPPDLTFKVELSHCTPKELPILLPKDGNGIKPLQELSNRQLRLQNRKLLSSSDLPATVKLIQSDDDASRVYVLGSSHVSSRSAEQALELIEKVQPDILMLELDSSRSPSLFMSESDLEGIQKKQGSVKGFLDLAINRDSFSAALANTQAGLAGQSKTVAGMEMRQAHAAADRCGSLVALGDRNMEVTMQRSFRSGPWTERLKLYASLALHRILMKNLGTHKHVEDLIQKSIVLPSSSSSSSSSSTHSSSNGEKPIETPSNVVHEMISALQTTFPTFYRAFFLERDIYLAQSLISCRETVLDRYHKNDNETVVVVGVVGLSHLQGIELLLKDMPPWIRERAEQCPPKLHWLNISSKTAENGEKTWSTNESDFEPLTSKTPADNVVQTSD